MNNLPVSLAASAFALGGELTCLFALDYDNKLLLGLLLAGLLAVTIWNSCHIWEKRQMEQHQVYMDAIAENVANVIRSVNKQEMVIKALSDELIRSIEGENKALCSAISSRLDLLYEEYNSTNKELISQVLEGFQDCCKDYTKENLSNNGQVIRKIADDFSLWKNEIEKSTQKSYERIIAVNESIVGNTASLQKEIKNNNKEICKIIKNVNDEICEKIKNVFDGFENNIVSLSESFDEKSENLIEQIANNNESLNDNLEQYSDKVSRKVAYLPDTLTEFGNNLKEIVENEIKCLVDKQEELIARIKKHDDSNKKMAKEDMELLKELINSER